MAERFVWVSAFLPHALRENETIQMCANWEELGGPAFFFWCGVTPISSAKDVVPVATGKHDDKPAVLITTPNAWA